MTKRNWKIKYFYFAWSCKNHAWLCEMDQKVFVLQTKGESQNWFCMIMRKFRTVMQNALGRQKLMLLYFLFCTIMRNCWTSCKMVILLLNSRFLGEEASEKPRRWCQVSTWSWPINRNLIYSFLGTSKQFLIWEFFIFSLSREFSIFSHFLTTQTCLVRPNLQAWVGKSHFFSRRSEDLEVRSMVN